MTKIILIFSDGTGQRGGLKPDQRLSNIYKLYRATRPGPNSRIDPKNQVAFYDPGLGKGEVGGWTFKRTRHLLEATIGTGIDTNIIDCYEKIIAHYEPGDRVCVFGFSRGAYTVRALASLMNLCGVPLEMPDGTPVPKYGKGLRKIASEAVQTVYNHGAGKPRNKQPYFHQREELGRRFRIKYKSYQNNNPEAKRGNVEPHFIGVFDTVAALGSNHLKAVFIFVLSAVTLLLILTFIFNLPWFLKYGSIALIGAVIVWLAKVTKLARKSYSPISTALQIDLTKSTNTNLSKATKHWAFWRSGNYDRFLSGQVKFARHAMAIDEERANFPRVAWGSPNTAARKKNQNPRWLKQVWFPGCHSDIGGSYPEEESRLSDIALEWMVDEIEECIPDLLIEKHIMQTFGDFRGLQHEERWMIPSLRVPWKKNPRYVSEEGELHISVDLRLNAGPVPIVEEVIEYRPVQLQNHVKMIEVIKKDINSN